MLRHRSKIASSVTIELDLEKSSKYRLEYGRQESSARRYSEVKGIRVIVVYRAYLDALHQTTNKRSEEPVGDLKIWLWYGVHSDMK